LAKIWQKKCATKGCGAYSYDKATGLNAYWQPGQTPKPFENFKWQVRNPLDKLSIVDFDIGLLNAAL